MIESKHWNIEKRLKCDIIYCINLEKRVIMDKLTRVIRILSVVAAMLTAIAGVLTVSQDFITCLKDEENGE